MSPPGAPEPSEEVTLIGEDGRERTFRLHDAFDLEGATYYLVEGADDPSEVLLLREVEGSRNPRKLWQQRIVSSVILYRTLLE